MKALADTKLQFSRVPREFEIDGRRYPDPNPDWTEEEVMAHYAQQHPKLANGKVQPPTEEGGKKVFAFAVKAGEKG